ncbi:MAG: Peptide chain release factor 2 [Candidatus Nomurabacteria bacterium GW2011_GWB1_35_20]|uniref:Peptide chain release factor 2 n=1 Tax=Candidatus Nomurabacteria bacterium GW2011_GWB1_35_20 TaxID=1618740 RepID=A0A0G0BPY4_9BACT|nr:MAG: Peptide chain release factor 2 [Candidatus Nomurabacteria bacterium GW2011_GWB1_35_20]
MEKDIDNIQKEIKKLETQTFRVDFWNDKNKAQAILKKLSELKNKLAGAPKYDEGSAIVTIISGAGGNDAEDFSRMLLAMYMKYAERFNWQIFFIHQNKNDHGGYRNVSFEIELEEKDFNIPENDLKIEYSRSSGPGGQNVNKRETAVRLVHLPTGISVHATGERFQEQNRERAMSILRAKIFKIAEENKKSLEESMKLKNTEIEWGSQIRSYVLHPYKMVKDHRTNIETSDINAVLNGGIDLFIEAEKNLC